MRGRGSFAAAALTLALIMHLPARAQPTRPVALPVVVHVAAAEGRPVVEPAFVDARIARANQIFAPYGVSFSVTTRLPLAERHAVQASRADRDALAPFVSDGAIHCFFVGSLSDVDEAGRVRRGVHWHARTRRGAHYVIVSAIAGLDVLAHELGHFLGNRDHSDVPGNLMSYEHTQVLPFLDSSQRTRLERTLRGYLRRKELLPLSR